MLNKTKISQGSRIEPSPGFVKLQLHCNISVRLVSCGAGAAVSIPVVGSFAAPPHGRKGTLELS